MLRLLLLSEIVNGNGIAVTGDLLMISSFIADTCLHVLFSYELLTGDFPGIFYFQIFRTVS